MLTALDSKVSDLNAEALGIPVRELMGNAGSKVAETLQSRYPGKRVVFVCGSGNNGGDGFAAALHMDPELVEVALLCEPSRIHTDESRFYYSLLECDISPFDASALHRTDIIVDCALGTGTIGRARGVYAEFIEAANTSDKPIVSVDVPSGLGNDLCIHPECTVTFMDVKEGMDATNCGEIIIADIGIPFAAYHEVGPGDMLRYPVPSKNSHKGQNGRLMIIAGGPYFGAPVMSAMSALRTGTDIVRLFSPESIHPITCSASPVLMVTDLPGDDLGPESVDMLLRKSTDYDVVLIGPGLGRSDRTIDAVREFISSYDGALVVDADALSALDDIRFNGPTILTPHRKEFEGLGGGNPEDIARVMNATILLKGADDTITDGQRTRINRSGTPAMTGAGTGDVLAGCIAGLMTKGMGAFDAACLGAYICGKAGELAFGTKSYGLIATDIIDSIPTVLKEGLYD